jgi:hypothetical protein
MIMRGMRFDDALNDLVGLGSRSTRESRYQADTLAGLIVERELEDLEERNARYARQNRVLFKVVPAISLVVTALLLLAAARGRA